MMNYGPRELAASFRTVRRNTLLAAEEIAEADYGYRPTPESRSVGEILSHIAVVTTSSYQAHAVQQVKTLAGLDFAALLRDRLFLESQLQTKSQILDALRQSGDQWASFLDGVSEDFLADVIDFPPTAEPPRKGRFEMILSVKEHEMHHRAQVMVIQRLRGAIPHLTRQRQARMAKASQDTAQGS